MISHLGKGQIKNAWRRFKRFLKPRRPNPISTAADAAPPSVPTHQPKTSEPKLVPEDLKSRENAQLEELPAEIRRLLLSTLKYEELRSLVHASPVYHQQYLLDREYLLSKCFETTLGSNAIIIDACAVYQSGLLNLPEVDPEEEIARFLKLYRDRCSSSSYQYQCLEPIQLDEIISILTFHHTVITPLTEYYANWILDNLTKETTNSPQSHEPLSRTEWRRVVRALYRFQLYCTVFGRIKDRQWWLEFEEMDVLRIFMEIYQPWEVEEIACIHTFAEKRVDQVFDDIYWDVHKDNPRFENHGRPITPPGAFNFDSGALRGYLLEGTVSNGLELLHDVLFKFKDHAELVSGMQKQISASKGLNLPAILDVTPQSFRRRQYPSHQDLKQKQRDLFPFQGDDENLPPLAWTLIWHGTYSNTFGWCIPNGMRFWGYIMWDATRLECAGAREVLARQWEERWKGGDPRDRYS